MMRAFIATGPARRGAGIDQGAEHRRICTAGPSEDATRHVADVGAVEIEANALRQGRVVLRETRIGAGGTYLNALETSAHALRGHLAVAIHRCRMGTEHPLDR